MRASKYPVVVLSVVLCAVGLLCAGPASAAPPGVVGESSLGGSVSQVDVYSPAMDRVVSNRVIRAAGGPAPTLYLLTGIGGGLDGISWWDDTDVREFFADKHVNVVMPIGGAYSMYTDWVGEDAVVSRGRWQTYLTQELPAALDPHLGTTGRNAVAGVSMSAASAIDLAIQAPERYSAVAAFSGCPWSSDPVGIGLVTAQLVRGGANPVNMWGVPGTAVWQAHDAFARAPALAGKSVYLSAGSGAPGRVDEGGLPFPPVEAIASSCTGAFAGRLAQVGVPATFVNRPEGSHTWGQFQADLHDSWPQLAAALGA